MPQTPHVEHHFTAGESVRDVVIGMSDGLTVPFALAAGLTGAVAASKIVVTAGLAEIAAGSIARCAACRAILSRKRCTARGMIGCVVGETDRRTTWISARF